MLFDRADLHVLRESIGRVVLVGRYFQDHLHCTPIPVIPKNKRRFAAIFNAFRYQNVKHAPKITASPSLQRKYQILNIGAEIVYPPSNDSPIEAAKYLLRIARQKQQWGEIPEVVGKWQNLPINWPQPPCGTMSSSNLHSTAPASPISESAASSRHTQKAGFIWAKTGIFLECGERSSIGGLLTLKGIALRSS